MKRRSTFALYKCFVLAQAIMSCTVPILPYFFFARACIPEGGSAFNANGVPHSTAGTSATVQDVRFLSLRRLCVGNVSQSCAVFLPDLLVNLMPSCTAVQERPSRSSGIGTRLEHLQTGQRHPSARRKGTA
eukprot:5434190-Amphidinium_carterae.1